VVKLKTDNGISYFELVNVLHGLTCRTEEYSGGMAPPGVKQSNTNFDIDCIWDILGGLETSRAAWVLSQCFLNQIWHEHTVCRHMVQFATDVGHVPKPVLEASLYSSYIHILLNL
jgi:hypothetical protein